MEIFDGKNHYRGAYEKFVLGQMVELLNTGRHWGLLQHPLVAQGYTPEALRRADAAFLTTLRALVDQWIDSGINEDGTETPSSRYVRGLPRGYSESLFDILCGWLGRNMPKPLLSSDGRIGIIDQPPNHYGLEAETYAREQAIYYFKELLESPVPHRLGKCKNPKQICTGTRIQAKWVTQNRNEILKRMDAHGQTPVSIATNGHVVN